VKQNMFYIRKVAGSIGQNNSIKFTTNLLHTIKNKHHKSTKNSTIIIYISELGMHGAQYF
jgi:hypothetical protein